MAKKRNAGALDCPGVLHAIGQADAALRIAGLLADDIFRVELRQARADVEELLASGAELIDAQEHYDAIEFPGGRRWDRLAIARERHAAAVARCKGGAQ